jgi:CRISPR-associated protein Cas2
MSLKVVSDGFRRSSGKFPAAFGATSGGRVREVPAVQIAIRPAATTLSAEFTQCHHTPWLLEISAGVFAGNPSARIRDVLWAEVQEYADQGRAFLTHTDNSEQGFTFRTHDHTWHPVHHEGPTLIRRPDPTARSNTPAPDSGPASGWSRASKRRRIGRE